MLHGIVAILTALHISATIVTGNIYSDNYFEFWLNGQLIGATNPLYFTPHQAVHVEFEWDGISDKVHAIMCQAFVTKLGYKKYIYSSKPGLGGEALLAKFDDGTVTNRDWKVFVSMHGPTAASTTASCSATKLDACIVESFPELNKRFNSSWCDTSAWSTACAIFTEAAQESVWGLAPTCRLSQCRRATNPFTCCIEIGSIDGLAVNCVDYNPSLDDPWVYDANNVPGSVIVKKYECLMPEEVFDGSDASFIWASDLELDNRIAFRLDVPVDSDLGTACFSRKTTVVVKHVGLVALPDLEIGDHILVIGNKYEPVYSFGHFSAEQESVFLQIYTDGRSTKPLELSKDHMILIETGHWTPASTLTIHDMLVKEDGSSSLITSIKTVHRQGAYAPFTASGTVVVNGLIASSYVAFQDSEYFMLGRVQTPITYQWLAHTFETIHRIAYSVGIADKETYTTDGVSYWVERPQILYMWLLRQRPTVVAAVMLPALAVLVVLSILEQYWYWLIGIVAGMYCICRRRRSYWQAVIYSEDDDGFIHVDCLLAAYM